MSSTYVNIPTYSAISWKAPVSAIIDLPSSNNTPGDTRVVLADSTIYTWNGVTWIAVAGGGSGAVDSVNGAIGVVSLTTDNIPATATNGYVPTSTLVANTVVGTDPSSELQSFEGWKKDGVSGGLELSLNRTLTDLNQTTNNNTFQTTINASIDSPNQSEKVLLTSANIGNNNNGFEIGTNGRAVTLNGSEVSAQTNSNIGETVINEAYVNIGNGTDPIEARGLSYSYGFGDIRDNVTLTGILQGYGFQPHLYPLTVMGTNSNVQAFYDYANYDGVVKGIRSFSAGPTINTVLTNNQYESFTSSPNITNLQGNAGYTALNVYPNITNVDDGNITGVNVNMNVANSDSGFAAGVNVNMNNVSVRQGVQASALIQDITFNTNQTGSGGNAFFVEYIPGGTAGSETVSLIGQTLTFEIQSGVSTALQIKAALQANISLASNISATITGVGSNPQVTGGPIAFSGGIDQGNKYAMYCDGDVRINGNLSFSGALSIGGINAFNSQPVVDSGGGVASLQSLITSPTVTANTTVNNGDTIGVNTAMLLNMGDNSAVTTNFLGVTALGLPAVISMGTGSTVDRVAGATFAVSLDGSATGGTVDTMALCSALAIPNGITTINRMYGYEMRLPFGNPATAAWGTYINADIPNYMQGSLVVGTSDVPTNASVAMEIDSTTKALLMSRMTTTQRDALTAVNGMQIYNTTVDKFQGYAAGAWVDLH